MHQENIFTPDLTLLAQQHNRGRTILFETIYGSKLYGCDIEGSDHDIRGIYMPGLHDFLSETKEEPATLVPDSDLGESDDIVYFPVGMFIDQVIRMKSNATEIFFAALNARARGTKIHPVMEIILDRRDDLISADFVGFVGHARQRAAKYIEGDDANDMTLQGNKHTLTCLTQAAAASLEAPALRIMDVDGLADTIAEHDCISRGENKSGDPVLRINTRQLPENTRIAEAIRMTETRLQRFRLKKLDADPGEMFKDLCTSLRMMETAADLMETGDIAFPRPRAEHYRAIRHGKIERKDILVDIDAARSAPWQPWRMGARHCVRLSRGNHVPVRNEIVAQVRYHALKSLSL